jgi:Mn2+/Fe2+ NRAMP family transporter
MTQTVQAAQEIPQPPSGWGRLAWFGPGIIWMLSAAASGELLFTPRVASLYGYTLLWAVLLALTLKFFINREIGRYTVCTGRRLLEGFADLPGPRNWAVWIVVVPQIAVAISTIAGLSSGAASALILEVGGGLQLWTIVTTITAVALVIWGRYEGVEKVSSTIAIVLGLGAIAAAISVGPDVGSVVAGVAPVVPHDVAYAEIRRGWAS